MTSRSTDLSATSKPGDQTRTALLMAGIKLFGTKGFEATSTREIAAAAQANIASIAYHFGGKEGLRVACAEMIGSRIQSVVGPALSALDPKGDPAQAQAAFERVIMGIADFMLGQIEARDIASFMVREMGSAGAVFDKVYADFIEPVHSSLCDLLGLATGQDPESDLIRIGTFSIAGQVVYFRIGHVIVARRMDWKEVGPNEVEAIKAVLLGNIRAFVATHRKEQS
ncbi:CerR family C-terminal domain-containing protein [Hoeflea sp. YIM 152468]|uniref:CerR family C-terminal domain-containing protein n=1 Tax=Hoeflea sp. YIM 152468 TaxID=3031759 RepID=UPI0023DB8FD3|nr:CerR family C-terminal domain-containing protein [Hoeflea sp. YIM 152468]MDF1607845.1 CerR family C-terminal domain-containing protein [Hoeflea sp. YIM 152468]